MTHCFIVFSLFTASPLQVHAKVLWTKPINHAQDSANKVPDQLDGQLRDEFIDNLCQRVIKVSPPYYAELEDTALAKRGHLEMPRQNAGYFGQPMLQQNVLAAGYLAMPRQNVGHFGQPVLQRKVPIAPQAANREDWSNKFDSSSWMDFLKFGGSTPSFDVIAKTKEYTSLDAYRAFRLKDIPEDYYAHDYVFRGAVVGPITRPDLVQTNTAFGLENAFPDLERQTFGFSVDPENPFRVLYFERWKATHTGTFRAPNLPEFPASGRFSNIPVFPFSITWNPDGKIIYEALSTAVDRFEGNTNGKVAVFGLFETVGITLPNDVGNWILASAQKLNRLTGSKAQTHSKEEDVPQWWKSKAVGAEKNDM